MQFIFFLLFLLECSFIICQETPLTDCDIDSPAPTESIPPRPLYFIPARPRLLEEFSCQHMQVNVFILSLSFSPAPLSPDVSSPNYEIKYIHARAKTVEEARDLKNYLNKYPIKHPPDFYSYIHVRTQINQRSQLSAKGIIFSPHSMQQCGCIFEADTLASFPFCINIITLRPESPLFSPGREFLILLLVSCIPEGIPLKLSWSEKCKVTLVSNVKELFV